MEHVQTAVELFWPDYGSQGVDNVGCPTGSQKFVSTGARCARSGAARESRPLCLRKSPSESDRQSEQRGVEIALAARDFLAAIEDAVVLQAQLVDLENPAADADAAIEVAGALGE